MNAIPRYTPRASQLTGVYTASYDSPIRRILVCNTTRISAQGTYVLAVKYLAAYITSEAYAHNTQTALIEKEMQYGNKVAILVTDYFEEAELTSPYDALRKAGAEVPAFNQAIAAALSR